MDAACTIQDSIHVFSLVRKYVSRILGTYHIYLIYQRGILSKLDSFYFYNYPINQNLLLAFTTESQHQ